MSTIQFKPVLAKLVMAGIKTETRRPVDEDESPIYQDFEVNGRPQRQIVAVQKKAYIKWFVGQSLPVMPGRGETSIGRAILMYIEIEQLQDITNENAVREGFQDRNQFLTYWDEQVYPFQPQMRDREGYVYVLGLKPDMRTIEERFADEQKWTERRTQGAWWLPKR